MSKQLKSKKKAMGMLAYSRQKNDPATRKPLPHNEMPYGYFEVYSASQDCRSILELRLRKSYEHRRATAAVSPN